MSHTFAPLIPVGLRTPYTRCDLSVRHVKCFLNSGMTRQRALTRYLMRYTHQGLDVGLHMTSLCKYPIPPLRFLQTGIFCVNTWDVLTLTRNAHASTSESRMLQLRSRVSDALQASVVAVAESLLIPETRTGSLNASTEPA